MLYEVITARTAADPDDDKDTFPCRTMSFVVNYLEGVARAGPVAAVVGDAAEAHVCEP